MYFVNQPSDVWTQLKITFDLPDFSICLFQTVSEVSDSDSQISTLKEVVSFSVVELLLETTASSFGETFLTFQLRFAQTNTIFSSTRSIRIQDERRNTKNTFRNLLVPRNVNISDPKHRQLVLSYKKTRENREIAIQMDKLRGVIVPEAVNSILDFLESKKELEATPLDQPIEPNIQKKKPMCITLSISDPEICFPKDPTDPKTKAFIVKASFLMKLMRSPGMLNLAVANESRKRDPIISFCEGAFCIFLPIPYRKRNNFSYCATMEFFCPAWFSSFVICSHRFQSSPQR